MKDGKCIILPPWKETKVTNDQTKLELVSQVIFLQAMKEVSVTLAFVILEGIKDEEPIL